MAQLSAGRTSDKYKMGSERVREKYIMLVDDNEDDVDLTLMALQKNNIVNEIVVAKGGEEALAYLLHQTRIKEPPKLPAVILLDINMPGVDGLQVLKQIRADEYTKRIPVVILTSSGEHRDLLEGYNLGANSYIRKPVDFNKFADAVRQLGLYWLAVNEPPEQIT
jgi:two-component system, response regulator